MDNDKIKEEIWFYLVSFDILSLILQKNIKSGTMKKLLPDNTGLENNEIKNVSLPNVYNLSLLSKNMYELFSQNNDYHQLSENESETLNSQVPFGNLSFKLSNNNKNWKNIPN